MDELTDSQQQALRNLAEKRSGAITAFVNIADARNLTEAGFAIRSRQGWDITDAGVAYLALLGEPTGGGNPVTDISADRGAGDPEPA